MSIDPQALQTRLTHLIDEWENEVVEFKNAGSSYSTSDIGKYFSALANEANLRGINSAWLVFGVHNTTRAVVGSGYRPDPERLHSLKQQIAQGSEPSMSFREIHELHTPQGRVLMFEIPPSPMGIPIAWQGHYHARAGESLTSLSLDKLDSIRAQGRDTDWTAHVVANATMAHFDSKALQQAREAFARKYANRFEPEEVKAWSDITFLDRAKLTQDGKITRAALLLLGSAESAHLLNPHPAQMTWKLEAEERAYEHFGPPFLLSSTRLYQRIRNVQLRILPDDQLVALEVSKYDQRIVLEALHNCIAHQDYERNGRVVVTERADRLIFESEGNFFEGQPDDYVVGEKVPRRYRNPCLTQAMAELNMIDTMGYGIHEMFTGQAKRFFPMPDYDLDAPDAVKLTLHGRVIDPAYSRLLIQHTDLPFEDVFALDRVQKHLPLDEATAKRLRRKKLIEGRKPHLHVSAGVAKAAGTKADYIHTRGQDDAFYKQLVLDYLEKFGAATRKEMDQLLMEKLSDALDGGQKQTKISNLLTNMRRAGSIRNTGSRRAPRWVRAE